MSEAVRQRLFLALWPTPSLAREIVAQTQTRLRSCGGRQLDASRLHITLVYLGPTDPARRVCVEQVAGQVRAEAFELPLSELGYWSRPKVIWIGPKQMPAVLLQLVQNLQAGLKDCGFTPEARPYQAHMTLQRKARRAPADGQLEPLSWWVDRFCLVESMTLPQGVEYRVLKCWPLGRS